MGGLAARCAEILEEFNAEHFFDSDQDRCALPLAQALVDVAQEHFAFFSADGQLTTDGAEATSDAGDLYASPMLVWTVCLRRNPRSRSEDWKLLACN